MPTFNTSLLRSSDRARPIVATDTGHGRLAGSMPGRPDGAPASLRGRRHSRGQALVEFALLAPVLLVLVGVGVDAGRMFFSWIAVVNAAREGAAYAAGNPTDTEGIRTRIAQEADGQSQGGEGLLAFTAICHDPSRTEISCSIAAGGNATGNTVTVQATRPFSFLTPVVGSMFGDLFSLRGSATAAVFGFLPNGGALAPGACTEARTASFVVTAVDMTVHLDASNSTPDSGRCATAGYDWDLGDGTAPFPPVVGTQTTYTYSTPGTYTITLVTSNPAGTATTSHSVTVPGQGLQPTPAPAPSAAPAAATTPDAVCSMTPTFTDARQGNSGKYNFYGAYSGQPAPASWYWTFGDGTTAYEQVPERHTFKAGGPYTVTLTISSGSCTASTSRTVAQ